MDVEDGSDPEVIYLPPSSSSYQREPPITDPYVRTAWLAWRIAFVELRMPLVGWLLFAMCSASVGYVVGHIFLSLGL